jgi:sensor histidine kinase regulating citrate/malate metabolism
MELRLPPKILKLMGCIISDCHTDDGGGMDPDSMRRCMSFGFSDKQSGSSIGQCMCFQLNFITC